MLGADLGVNIERRKSGLFIKIKIKFNSTQQDE